MTFWIMNYKKYSDHIGVFFVVRIPSFIHTEAVLLHIYSTILEKSAYYPHG